MKTISADCLVSSYDARHLAGAAVELGETFAMETHDRIPEMIAPEELTAAFRDPFDHIYSVTGPVFIKGAGPGTTLAIDIVDIEITDSRGIICATPGRAGFGDKIKQAHHKIVAIESDQVLFSEKIRVPLLSHVGKIATTPAAASCARVAGRPPARDPQSQSTGAIARARPTSPSVRPADRGNRRTVPRGARPRIDHPRPACRRRTRLIRHLMDGPCHTLPL